MRFQNSFFAAILAFAFSLAANGCQTAPDGVPAGLEMHGGMPENTFTGITLAGSEFKRYEGRKVVVRIGGPTPLFYPEERTAMGWTRVSGGSFRLDFPDSREVGLYKELFLYFDQNRDGECTPQVDEGHKGAIGGGGESYVYPVEPWMIFPMEAKTCLLIESP